MMIIVKIVFVKVLLYW